MALINPEFRISTFADSVKFEYRNWKGETHQYVVRPESLAFGPYTGSGKAPAASAPHVWVLHAQVVTRDEEQRPGKRTFLISGIRNPVSVVVQRTGGS